MYISLDACLVKLVMSLKAMLTLKKIELCHVLGQ